MIKHRYVKPSPCPYCGDTPNAAANSNGDAPKPGDITICSNCRNYLEFGEDMELLKTTEKHVDEVSAIRKKDLKYFIERYFND